MLKQKLIAGIAASLLLAGCGARKTIRLGTAPKGGTYYAFGKQLQEIARNEHMEIDVRTTSGSMANLRLLSKGYIQAGISQSDQISLNYYSNSNPLQGYSSIASLYTEEIQIAVLADSDIKSVEDLEGKHVSIGQEESGTADNAKAVLRAYGMSGDNVRFHYMNYAEATSALLKKEISAMFITAGTPVSALSSLSEQTRIRLLPLNRKVMVRLQNTYPYYTETVIPKGTYAGVDQDVPTLGIRAILLASDQLPEETVYRLTAMLFSHSDEFRQSLGINTPLSSDSVLEGVTIPLHKGAARYYAEQGIDTEFLGIKENK